MQVGSRRALEVGGLSRALGVSCFIPLGKMASIGEWQWVPAVGRPLQQAQAIGTVWAVVV